jgi:two-component system LytT family response regulator
VNSVDYLLKPVDPDLLARALKKLEHIRGSVDTTQPELKALLTRISQSLSDDGPRYLERIASRLGDRIRFLDLAQVTHFYAEEKLTYAISGSKAYSIDHAIAELEKKLNPLKFHRIHRGTIVNLDWIKEVSFLPGGGLNVRLRDARETDLTVARDRAREFRTRVGC